MVWNPFKATMDMYITYNWKNPIKQSLTPLTSCRCESMIFPYQITQWECTYWGLEIYFSLNFFTMPFLGTSRTCKATIAKISCQKKVFFSGWRVFFFAEIVSLQIPAQSQWRTGGYGLLSPGISDHTYLWYAIPRPPSWDHQKTYASGRCVVIDRLIYESNMVMRVL